MARRRVAAETTAECRLPTPSTEECFEKIAKPSSAEFEFHTAVAAGAPKTAPGSAAPPIGRRLKPTRLIPIGAETIVFRTFFRVAQDLVRFIDLLELLLCRSFFLWLGEIWMVFSR